VVPLLTGFTADHIGLSHALFVPVVCYVWIAVYGLMAIGGALKSWRGVSALTEALG
jgi:fucose permease